MTLYHTMQAIYEINVMPDKLKSLEGRVFALRLFIDVLLYVLLYVESKLVASITNKKQIRNRGTRRVVKIYFRDDYVEI